MKYDRITFGLEVMNPALALNPSNYNTGFSAPEYAIEKQGDVIALTHTGTGVTVHLPWAASTGAQPSKVVAELAVVPAKGKR